MLRITLSEPVTVARAAPDVRGWGPFQFPGLARLPDGRIQLAFHAHDDSATAYGLQAVRAVSADDGRTWNMLSIDSPDAPLGWNWQTPPVHLPNGDVLLARQLRSLPVAQVALPPEPLAIFPTHAVTHAYYRVEDLPENGRDGWRLYRKSVGRDEFVEEAAHVNLPGEVRCVTEGCLTFPWFQEMFLAPDGAVWSVNYDHRIVDGVLQEKICAKFLRSIDGGRTFELWSEITYDAAAAAITAADKLAAQRDGFTEPSIGFLPDGSVLCLLRTSDGAGVGPLYLARSIDGGRSWSTPVVFDDLGVWPQLLTLANGVTVASYGRPGVFVRATADSSGLHWNRRVEVLAPGAYGKDSCSYTAMLPLGNDELLLAYSNFDVADAEGRPCKALQVRRVKVE